MSLAMSRAEREAFLAGTHVGIVSVAEDGRGPCAAPVWYHYAAGGEVRFATGPESRKARLLHRAGRASQGVQTETPPNLYVSVEGPTSIAEVDFERDIREMALRYLGPRMGAAYLQATYPNGTTDEVLVRLKPLRWWSRDFRNFTGSA